MNFYSLIGWDEVAVKPLLLNNKFSWNVNHNMLYIDSPVGTGKNESIIGLILALINNFG